MSLYYLKSTLGGELKTVEAREQKMAELLKDF